jgi:hypothetical protein
MKSYQCDSSQTSKVNGDIRRDLNNQLISFQGEVAFTEDDELQKEFVFHYNYISDRVNTIQI